MTGCSMEQALGLSARAAVLFIAKAVPEKLLDPVRYGNSLIGLQGNVEHIAQASHNLTAHLGTSVTAVHPLPAGGFRIEHAGGRAGRRGRRRVRHAALRRRAAPHRDPGAGAGRGRPRAVRVLRLRDLDPPRSGLHARAAPALVGLQRSRRRRLRGGQRLVRRPATRPGRAPLPLFKSWATARSVPPAEEIFRRAFRHPLITPDFIQLQGQLAAHQGTAGVFFAGSYVREVDSQETALVSAMDVVRAIAPEAPNLLLLQV